MNESNNRTTEFNTMCPAFQITLSSLSLSRVSITWGLFVNLIDYFPDLRCFHFSQSLLRRIFMRSLCFPDSHVESCVSSHPHRTTWAPYPTNFQRSISGTTTSRSSTFKLTSPPPVSNPLSPLVERHPRAQCWISFIVYVIPPSRIAPSWANLCSSKWGQRQRNPPL